MSDPAPGTPQHGQSKSALGDWRALVAGGMAGLVTRAVVSPLDVVKIR